MSNDQVAGSSVPHDSARRSFLRVLAVSMALAMPGLPALAAAAVEAGRAKDTLQVMTTLSGLEFADEDQAQTYLQVLLSHAGKTAVTALLDAASLSEQNLLSASRAAPLRPVAETALSLWLTGLAPAADAQEQPTVLDYARAGVWQAIPFTKPPGFCGGMFGYWANPPATS